MVELTHQTFDEFVEQHEFALVHFWAEWNPHDLTARERLEQLPADIRERIAFGRLNADVEVHFDLARAHDVVTIPYLALYCGGTLVDERAGLRTPEALEEWLRVILAKERSILYRLLSLSGGRL